MEIAARPFGMSAYFRPAEGDRKPGNFPTSSGVMYPIVANIALAVCCLLFAVCWLLVAVCCVLWLLLLLVVVVVVVVGCCCC